MTSEKEIKQGVFIILGIISILVAVVIFMTHNIRALGEYVRTDGREAQSDIFDAFDRCVDAGYDGVRDMGCFNYTIEEKIARGIQ